MYAMEMYENIVKL